MPERQVLEASTLVRPECRPGNDERGRRGGRSELPPRMIGIMIATTCATFVTLSGSYNLFV